LLKWSLVLAAVLLQSACSNRTEQAQEILQSHLGEKVYLEFQNVEAFPGGAVCGEYRTNDPIRGGSRYRPFIVRGEIAEGRPSKQERAIFCSEDAATALRATLGIGPVGEEENQLSQIRDELQLLHTALEQYRKDNQFLPTTKQGLAALVSAPSTPPVPMKSRPEGYLGSLPTDPWDRQYIYEVERLGGRVLQEFQLYTLGADGVVGGEGSNADVSLEHLKYLDYIIPQ